MEGRMVYVLLAAAVAFSLLARFHESFPGDVPLLRWVQSWQHPVTTVFMEAVSLIGRAWFLFGLAGVVASALFVVHRRREGFAAVGTLAILGLNPLIQLLVDRPRPPTDLVGIASPLGGLGFLALDQKSFFGCGIHTSSSLMTTLWPSAIKESTCSWLNMVQIFGSVVLTNDTTMYLYK